MADEAVKERATFYMRAVEDPVESEKAGRPIFKDVPFVKIMVPGDRHNVVDVPVWDDPRVKPGKDGSGSHTSRFPAEWAAFKAQQAQVETGTPLSLLPGIPATMVKELEYFHIRTVEDLISAPASSVQGIMGINKLKGMAEDYVARAKGAAPDKALRAALEAKDNELAALRAQMASIISRLDAKDAAPAPVDGEAPPKRRGRPPKAPQAEG